MKKDPILNFSGLRPSISCETFYICQVKYAVLLCGDDEDKEVVKAASGSLAMLTGHSQKICKKVFDVSYINMLVLL